jgi:hypothetical protein
MLGTVPLDTHLSKACSGYIIRVFSKPRIVGNGAGCCVGFSRTGRIDVGCNGRSGWISPPVSFKILDGTGSFISNAGNGISGNVISVGGKACRCYSSITTVEIVTTGCFVSWSTLLYLNSYFASGYNIESVYIGGSG